MKKIILQVAFLNILCLMGSSSFAQHRIKFTELNFDALGKPSVVSGTETYNASQYGLGASVYVGKEIFGAVLQYDYHKIDLKKNITNEKSNISFSELFLGLRYYPMRPTAIIGYTAVRFTASALYGFDFEPNWRPLLSAGFTFSSVRNTSGVTLNVDYRPGTYLMKKVYSVGPSLALRLGILIGPKGK